MVAETGDLTPAFGFGGEAIAPPPLEDAGAAETKRLSEPSIRRLMKRLSQFRYGNTKLAQCKCLNAARMIAAPAFALQFGQRRHVSNHTQTYTTCIIAPAIRIAGNHMIFGLPHSSTKANTT